MTTQEMLLYGAFITAILAFASAIAVPFISGGLSRFSKISEFRQDWINELRKDVADYMGAIQKWANAATHKEDKWKQFSLWNEASVIFWRIEMRINPLPNKYKNEDDEFLRVLGALRDETILQGPQAKDRWTAALEAAVLNARALLKREWEVTKGLPLFWSKKA